MKIKITIVSIIIIFLVEIGLNLLGFAPNFYITNSNLITIKPKKYFIKDKICGWKLTQGKFDSYSNNKYICTYNINNKGYRIVPNINSKNYSSHNKKHIKTISIYGCSYTFGQSVSDSSNLSYYLQTMLPDYIVQNHGVPGYSLLQMFLTMEKDVRVGDKPEIAIINYGSFTNSRTVLSGDYQIHYRKVFNIFNNTNIDINHPYIKSSSDNSIKIDYLNISSFKKGLPFFEKSAIIYNINNIINNIYYKSQQKQYDNAIIQLFHKINDFCKAHNIKLLIFGLDKDSSNILLQLGNIDIKYGISSIDISSTEYNCQPYDPYHPNDKAHNIYAKEIYSLLKGNKLINN